MSHVAEALESLDTGLFHAITSQTTGDDKRSLLAIQRAVRNWGDYVYLEIGSHLGGTIQPHYVDSRCRLIYSIDKRPLIQPDERGQMYEYRENSTGRMRHNLHTAFPQVDPAKLQTFDCDASEVPHGDIETRPSLCFIDGEHTNPAVVSDFNFCRAVCASDAVIGFHDTCFVFEGLDEIKRELAARGERFVGLKLGGSVYVLLLGAAIERYAGALKAFAQDETAYFTKAARDLSRIRLANRYPVLRLLNYPQKIIRRLKRLAS